MSLSVRGTSAARGWGLATRPNLSSLLGHDIREHVVAGVRALGDHGHPPQPFGGAPLGARGLQLVSHLLGELPSISSSVLSLPAAALVSLILVVAARRRRHD